MGVRVLSAGAGGVTAAVTTEATATLVGAPEWPDDGTPVVMPAPAPTPRKK
jgi:hypothetical protein